MGERAQTKAFDKLLKVCKSILWRAKFTLLIFHLQWHRELWKTHLLAALNLNNMAYKRNVCEKRTRAGSIQETEND